MSTFNIKLTKYAKHLTKQFDTYRTYQYSGKNGADSENEKGYWRGMADSVEAFLQDLKNVGLIEHTGLHGDIWPDETTKRFTIKITNIEVTFVYQPNEDIYTPIIPTELFLGVILPTNFNVLSKETKDELLKVGMVPDMVYYDLLLYIKFDKPDEPDFDFDTVTYDYEVILE